MRYLAIDLGARRTGFAVGDSITGIITPAGVLEVGGDDTGLAALAAEVARHEPDALVIGLPLNMDGTEGEPARAARAFGERLAERCTLPVHFQDERLTSFAADQAMARTGRTRGQKKKLRDALAAAEILRDFLSE